MENMIPQEADAAKKYLIPQLALNEKQLPELSLDNVARVEAMIQADSRYSKSTDPKAGPEGNYGGSIAYWMIELKKVLDGKESEHPLQDAVTGAVNSVDRDNSTHLNADKHGREVIAERIQKKRNTLLDELKDTEKGLRLIEYISSKTGDFKGARRNISFASKFCHYACFYMFEGQSQDNYPIFDRIVRESLPAYLDYYGIKRYTKKGLEDYQTYRSAIDEVIRESGNKISRNGFDHILWYYFRGRV